MTGEKNRFKTTEKLWDLDDKQLKTPVHDAMVLWLMDEDNLKALLYPLCRKYTKEHYSEKEYELNKCENIGLRYSSEEPIMSSPTFIAGYADLMGEFRFNKFNSKEIIYIPKNKYREVKYYYEEYGDDMTYKIQTHLERYGNGDKEVDVPINHYMGEEYYLKFLIEVKPYIDSFGAVLRQINSYMRFSQQEKYCLFTFDNRFDKQFESQGIKVLHPPINKNAMLKLYGL